MSRHETASSAARQTRITRELTADEKAKVESYSELPNIRGIDEAIKKIKELFDVVVNESYIRRAVSQSRLDRHEICHVIHFSERDLYTFIVLGTRKNPISA